MKPTLSRNAAGLRRIEVPSWLASRRRKPQRHERRVWSDRSPPPARAPARCRLGRNHLRCAVRSAARHRNSGVTWGTPATAVERSVVCTLLTRQGGRPQRFSFPHEPHSSSTLEAHASFSGSVWPSRSAWARTRGASSQKTQPRRSSGSSPSEPTSNLQTRRDTAVAQPPERRAGTSQRRRGRVPTSLTTSPTRCHRVAETFLFTRSAGFHVKHAPQERRR